MLDRRGRVPLLLVLSACIAATDEHDLRDDLELLREEEPTEVVSGPSKALQRRAFAPAAVTVLTSEELHRFGYRTVAEAVRGLTGFVVTTGRDADFIGVRGLGLPGDFNTRILVTLNGHTLNELWNNSSALGEDLGIDIGIVDRIEVVRGPGSSLWGQSAFLAQVHIVTRTGAEVNWARGATEVGSFGLVRATATAGNEIGEMGSFLVNGWVLRRGGEPLFFREYAGTRTGGFAPESADRTLAFGWLAHLRLGDFTLHGKYHRRDQGLAFAPFHTVFGDTRNALAEARGFGELRYDKGWRPGGALREAQVLARVYLDHYRFNDFLAYDNGTPPVRPEYLFRDEGEADWYGAELRGVLDFGRWSRFVVGAEYQKAFHLRSRSFIPGEFFTRAPAPGEARDVAASTPLTTAAAYLQDELWLHDRVAIVGGLRFDHNSRFQRALSPRAAVVLRPAERATLKLLYGVGFRNPTAFEAFFDDGRDIAANPALKAERIHTAEVVWEHRLRDDLSLRAGFFFSRIDDLIRLGTVDIDPRSEVVVSRRQFQNTPGRVQVVGGDLRLNYRPEYGLLAYLSLSLQRVRLEGEELPNSPGWMVSGGFSAPLVAERLYVGLEAHAVGGRLAGDARSLVDPYLLVHLHLLTVRVLEKLSISAKVYNLLDATYGEVPGIERVAVTAIPGPRRTFMLRMELDW